MKMKKGWGVMISSDMFSFWLFTGKLSKPSGWDYRECKWQAKYWDKYNNAARWAAVGNKWYEEHDHDVKLKVCPLELSLE